MKEQQSGISAKRLWLSVAIGMLTASSPLSQCLADGLNAPTVSTPSILISVDSSQAAQSGEQAGGSVLNRLDTELGDHGSASVQELSGSSAEGSTPSQGEALLQKYPNGKLHIERYVVEDADGNIVNHGPYKEFDTKGDQIRSGSFKMGLMDGTWTQALSVEAVQALAPKVDGGFRPPFRSTAHFEAGQLHGDWVVADSKGNAVFVWQFENGKRENISNWFDSRHTIIQTIAYQADVPHGPSTVMVTGQREPKTQSYVHGQLVQSRVDWYERGRKRLEESVLTAAAGRIAAHDWWNSSVRVEKAVESTPIRHGQFTSWHPNGEVSCTGQYDQGQPTGEFTWWYANSQMLAKGSYSEQGKTGRWTWWHENGMKMLDGHYEDGRMVGIWSRWQADGALVAREPAEQFPIEQFEELEPVKQAQQSQPVQRSVPARNASLQRRNNLSVMR